MDTDTQQSAPVWLTELYALIREGKTERALDLAFNSLLDPQQAGDFVTPNTVLSLIDVDQLDINLMVGILSATHYAKDKMPNRVGLVQRIGLRLQEVASDRSEDLIKGLR